MRRRDFLGLFGKGAAAAAVFPVVNKLAADELPKPKPRPKPDKTMTARGISTGKYPVLDTRDMSILNHTLTEDVETAFDMLDVYPVTEYSVASRTYEALVYIDQGMLSEVGKTPIEFGVMDTVRLRIHDPHTQDLLAEFDARLVERQIQASADSPATALLVFREVFA